MGPFSRIRRRGPPWTTELLAGLLRGVLRFLMRELGRFMGFERKLHGLLGVFMAGEVIFFTVMHGGGAMRVCGLFVKFGGALMRIVWHDESFLAQANSCAPKF